MAEAQTATEFFGEDWEKATDTRRSNPDEFIIPKSPKEAGTYELEIGAAKHYKGFKASSCIVEFTIKKTDVPERKVGQKVTFVKKFTVDAKKNAIRDCRQLIAGALGIPYDQTTQAQYGHMTSAKQPFMGIIVKCEAFDSPRVNDDDTVDHFTNFRWSLVKGK